MIVFGFVLMTAGIWFLMMRAAVAVQRWIAHRARVGGLLDGVSARPRPPLLIVPTLDIGIIRDTTLNRTTLEDLAHRDVLADLTESSEAPTPLPLPPPPPGSQPVDVPWEHWADQWAGRPRRAVKPLAG
jgi:hypothetical protein